MASGSPYLQSLLRTPQPSQRSLTPAAQTALLLLLLCLACLLPLGCATGASGPMASAAQANQAAAATGTVAPAFFGMVVRNAADEPGLAAGSQRLWDAGVTWAALEPASGVFHWDVLDAEVSAAQASGAQVVLTLGMTPSWASSKPALPSAYGAGATAMPAHLADWDAYVSAVVTRYQGRVAAYEVWNNPADSAYWSGPASTLGSDMATLSAHAAAAIRAADGTALTIAPALDAPGMAGFLSAGGSASVDVFTTALSLAGQAPESLVAELSLIRAAMANTSAETKPLWNDQPSWTLPASGLSDEEQGAYAARALVLNASFGISRLHWYAWDQSDASTLRLVDGAGQPTEAATAYTVMQGWLSGAAINGCSSTAAGLWNCQLVRAGRPGWIVWSTSGTAQASGMGMSTVTDLQGSLQALDASGSVAVGESPGLLQ